MFYRDTFRHLFQNAKESFRLKKGSDMSYLFSTSKTQSQYADDVMECLQFGICDVHRSPLKQIPYFHF